MANPLISQGSLNKLRASVVWSNFPSLNVTAPYLSKEGVRLSLQGETTLYMPTMTGAVTAQEPYMMIEVVIHLLKSQALANLYKQQMETNSLLGDATIRPDATALGPYQLVNGSIKSIRELDFSGENAVFAVTCGGYYLINSSLFS
jgi:hypothetical protein